MFLSDDELRQFAHGQESGRVERKGSLSDREQIKKTICAFANDLADCRKPGILLIGLDDGGSCAGLKPSEASIRTIVDFRGEGNLLPLPTFCVEWRRIDSCDVLVVQVEPSAVPPVRLRGRVWVRIGPTVRAATPEEEKRLSERRRWHDLPFDHQPIDAASPSDLDIRLFEGVYLPGAIDREVLEANQRSSVEQLASLRFLTSNGRPTVAGILVLGKDPRQWVPAAYVQFARFAGTEISDDVQDQKELFGPIPTLMQMMEETLAVNIRIATQIGGGVVESRNPDYPVDALRQLVRNAVMHRAYEGTHAPVRVHWFADRIEIYNPGGPFGIVNRGNFGQPGVTDYRNPVLAEAMKVLGYVQRFGAGIPIARRELERNRNPAPEFFVEAEHVLVTVRKQP